jgi:NAD dependent epimerase/dehydratase
MANERVLVTGADGFIGSHLAEMLAARGRPVRALCFYNSFNSWGWLDESPARAGMEIVAGDVRDPHFCDELMRGVHTVFHLAALVAIPYSYIAPDSYLDTNVRGTLNICQAARRSGVARVIHTSTSEVYGTAQRVPIDESHALNPQSPYAASKVGADAIAMSFHRAFGLPVTIARPFNAYGPRQSARAVIPAIITQIAAGAKRIRLGDLRPTRDFTHVLDTCRGLIALAECDGSIGETVNIGSNREITIGDTFEAIRELMNADVQPMVDEARLRPAHSEVMRLWCDNRRLAELTGWRPEHGLRDGLSATIEWIARPENLARYKPDALNL